MRTDNEETIRELLGRIADEAPESLEFDDLGRLSRNEKLESRSRWVTNPAVTTILAATVVLLSIGLVAALTVARGGEPAVDPFQVQTASTVGFPDTPAIPYESPNEAAIAAARAEGTEFNDAEVTRMFVIYAGQAEVDLRVLVEAGDSCRLYAVTGRVSENAIEWRSWPALPCGP